MGEYLRKRNPHLLLALAITLGYHGAMVFFTFRRTYDAYVHIFFGDHYARAWFDHWEYRWYTGFPMISYPPGSQQSIALLSKLVGLENGFIIVQTFAMMMVVLGIYRFSKIWVSEEAAGYAALLTVFSSSLTETIHVFGQLPTTFSLGFLLNALPYVYQYLREGRWHILVIAWSVNAATTAGHHVTTLFGAVFFVAPIMALAIVEDFYKVRVGESPYHPAVVTRLNLKPLIVRRLRRIVPVVLRCAIYGVGLIAILLLIVFPYWAWSRSDPITQVSIPHASRDSFIENTAAGLVFWVVPYGMFLIILPYLFYKAHTTKAWPLAASMSLMFLLGTGGTTPIPRMLLGGAFDILTLDRFTFWATICMLPFAGEFVRSLRFGRFGRWLSVQFGREIWIFTQFVLAVGYIVTSILIVNLTQFRTFQPDPIDMQPIVTFLEKDQHWRWRYLTLGFGDQVAWLGAQTTANSVDGNYHSARRLPELTTTPVERLEGAKFRGIPGLGSLQQFLGVPEKYNLKYVFSNDQFYDPLLFFSGWHRLGRLENGIMVWEREDIPPLPEVLPRKEIPMYQRIMWGILPMGAIVSAFAMMTSFLWFPVLEFAGVRRLIWPVIGLWMRSWPYQWVMGMWIWLDELLLRWSELPDDDDAPQMQWQVWVDWIQRLPQLAPPPPTARHIRVAIVASISLIGLATVVEIVWESTHEPAAVVESYFDHLDFRRFDDAYSHLDPNTRPSFELYMLGLSVKGGLRASYAKLDSIVATPVEITKDRTVVRAQARWITALAYYDTDDLLVLVRRDGNWYIQLVPEDLTSPPDQFFRRGSVVWRGQGRRRVTDRDTAFADVQDRPELEVLSAHVVRHNDNYSVVGELVNTDADPADVTVTSILYDDEGQRITSYNAQQVINHKILPKEITPFRVDFEGVAGLVFSDTQTVLDFEPNAFTPITYTEDVALFDVYAKAVVTGRNLDRDVGAQHLEVVQFNDGRYELIGELINSGTIEAIIPHVLATYYNDQNEVVWVDHLYIEESIRPQRTVNFRLPITPADSVEIVDAQGRLFSNILDNKTRRDPAWLERIRLPDGTGYTSVRLTVHYFVLEE